NADRARGLVDQDFDRRRRTALPAQCVSRLPVQLVDYLGPVDAVEHRVRGDLALVPGARAFGRPRRLAALSSRTRIEVQVAAHAVVVELNDDLILRTVFSGEFWPRNFQHVADAQ